MAKQQAQKNQQQAARNEGPSTGTMPRGSAQTGTRDENYNLISVLYHSLQGAETVSQYLRDATEAGEQDLQEFFQEVQRSYVELAQRGKMLLAERLEVGEEGDEEDEEEEEEDED